MKVIAGFLISTYIYPEFIRFMVRRIRKKEFPNIKGDPEFERALNHHIAMVFRGRVSIKGIENLHSKGTVLIKQQAAFLEKRQALIEQNELAFRKIQDI
mmetsp:Transcript_784/g.977  ORF Transcript_784/g.977 Transcript_784/m.977 type:complete len:99 (+) Transcript_784:1398-1694(+)|eukprot:CAMPEP_0170484034 /NCGR_PEP_ID=MMETSP0208-20121228/3589_1 /TAXON_ID=197538 /ORGANISM="Strombidium inclinatum, Strain S3" /LENGTH=98 /DNA_ID=CAMNT_0010757271 /DNA_START=1966 /DNA_END=2262 /DNA_ORIENTATION=+